MKKSSILASIAALTVFASPISAKEVENKLNKKIESKSKTSNDVSRSWTLVSSKYTFTARVADTTGDDLTVGEIIDFTYGFHSNLGSGFSTENIINLAIGSGDIEEIEEKKSTISEGISLDSYGNVFAAGFEKRYLYNMDLGVLGLKASPFLGGGLHYTSVELTEIINFEEADGLTKTYENKYYSLMGNAGFKLSHSSGLMIQAKYAYIKPAIQDATYTRSRGLETSTSKGTDMASSEVITLGVGYQF